MEELIYLGSQVLAIIWEAPSNKQHVITVVKKFKDKFLEVSGYEYKGQPKFIPSFSNYQLSCYFLTNFGDYIRFESNPEEMLLSIADVINFFDMSMKDLD